MVKSCCSKVLNQLDLDRALQKINKINYPGFARAFKVLQTSSSGLKVCHLLWILIKRKTIFYLYYEMDHNQKMPL